MLTGYVKRVKFGKITNVESSLFFGSFIGCNDVFLRLATICSVRVVVAREAVLSADRASITLFM